MDTSQPWERAKRTWHSFETFWRSIVNKEIVKHLPAHSQGKDGRADKPLVGSNGGQYGLLFLEKSVDVGCIIADERVDLGHYDRRRYGGRHRQQGRRVQHNYYKERKTSERGLGILEIREWEYESI